MKDNRIKRFLLAAGSLILSLAIGAVVAAQTYNATNQAGCTTQGGKWCASAPPATGGWCTSPTMTCPAYDSASCTAQAGKWCSDSTGHGWCMTGTGNCPAYTQADCTAQGGKWCTSTTVPTAAGWCATGGATCPTSTTTPPPSPTPPPTTTDPQTSCTTTGGKWCQNAPPSTGGWCLTGSGSCPAYDSASCSAQGGKWCTPSGGGSGWCNSGPNATCPAATETECTAQAGKWCTSQYGSPWCATGGSTCPSSTPTPTPTPTPYINWPQTKESCAEYKGQWCDSIMSTIAYSPASTGWCTSAGTGSCPKPVPAGMMQCFGDTYVPSGGTCPAWPNTSADCTAKSGLWCTSTTTGHTSSATSGYCQFGATRCHVTPPSGQITCPDGVSFASTLSGCPKIGATTPSPTPTPTPTKVICPDGSSATTLALCPPPKQLTPDLCDSKGGRWCFASTGGQGWCQFDNSPCPSTKPAEPKPVVICPDGTTVRASEACPKVSTPPPTPPPEPPPVPKPVINIKQTEREIKQLAREIKMLERDFKRYKAADALTKAEEIKKQAEALKADDPTIYEKLQAVREAVEDLRFLRDDLFTAGPPGQGEMDEKMRQRALKQLQTGVKQFGRQLKTLQSKINRLEKKKITVPVELKEAVAQGQAIVKTALEAKNFETAQEAVNELSDVSATINDLTPQLDQLEKLPRVLGLANAEIKKADGKLKQAQSLVAKLNIDAGELLAVMEGGINEMKTALARAKTGDFGGEDPFAFLAANVLEKVDDVNNSFEVIRSISEGKRATDRLNRQLANYDRVLKNLRRQGAEVTEAEGALTEAKEKFAEVKGLLGGKLNEERVETLLSELSDLFSLMESLEQLLNLRRPESFEIELRRPQPTEEAPTINVPTIEKLLLKTNRTASFFSRRTQFAGEF